MKALAYLVSIFFYLLGDLSSYFMLRYDWNSLYPFYQKCMDLSFEINERYKLSVWK